jgi:signal transduction histidine kinase
MGFIFLSFVKLIVNKETKTSRITPSSIESFVFNVALAFFLSEILIALIVGIFSFYFIRSIVDPVKKINESAKQIAQGDFSIKIKKEHEDEIGELCNTINYMTKELAAAERMKNDFISSVSHELRTPLTAIKGWAETMQDSMMDFEVTKKGMSTIVSESERLCGIVEELLEFSTIRNSRMTLRMNKLDLLAELGEAVYILKDRVKQESKLLLYSEPESFPPVLGDKNRLRQIFINVIDNAIKYTPAGGVVNVSARIQDKFICVEVSDNGCGIPKIHLPRVKEKFYKANKNQIGAGIGLAIANEITVLHSGKLIIDSEESVGTTVNILIPIMNQSE